MSDSPLCARGFRRVLFPVRGVSGITWTSAPYRLRQPHCPNAKRRNSRHGDVDHHIGTHDPPHSSRVVGICYRTEFRGVWVCEMALRSTFIAWRCCLSARRGFLTSKVRTLSSDGRTIIFAKRSPGAMTTCSGAIQIRRLCSDRAREVAQFINLVSA